MRALRALRLLPGIALAVLAIANPLSAGAVPSQTQIYWGAYVNGPSYGFGAVPRDMRAIQTFEAHAGKPMSIIGFGSNWVANGVFQKFDPVAFENVRQHGSIPLFSWTSQGGDLSKFTNAIITAGTYDADIHAWARAAKAWGHPFFLKFDHEMDGSWFPWGEGTTTVGGPIVNGNAPGSYVLMYRHVHDIFTQEGATNVTWVWVVNQENTSGRYPPLSRLYPGDQYVDWVGIDGYNRFVRAWQTFTMLFRGWVNPAGDNVADTYQLVQNVAPTKPMMIPEFGSIEDPADPNRKAAWMRDTYLTQVIRNFPAIKAVIYYNFASSAPTIPIESSSKAQTAFANSMALSTYTTNSFTQLPLGAIKPSAEQVAYLTPVADTFIASDLPTSTAGGTSASLAVNGSATQTRKAYLRFDLTSLATRTIDQAVLQISTTTASNAGSGGTIAIKYDANNTWKEQFMSWNNHGGPFDVVATPIASFTAPAQPSTTYVATLPKSFISTHAGGLVSVQLDTTATDDLVFASRESTNSTARPQLVVAYR